MVSEFNLTDEQRATIDNVMRELLSLCQIYQVPMFATVAVANSKEGTEYCNNVYGAGANEITLKEDRIREHILIASGFSAVPKREVHNVRFEDLLNTAQHTERESDHA